MDRSSLCRFYFDIGASHTDILHFIAQIHGICISMRTLMRHLGVIQKRRKRTPSSIIHAASFIEKKIRNHLHAFRGIPESDLIFEACVYERIEITKDTVEILTKILDPVNTEYRLRRKMRRTGFIGHGPDYIWHVGRFSDLKQCGYSILVCMDGFSGYIILASLFKINDWESEIARFFLKIIKMRKGYPVLMKGNLSTQSDYLDRIQDCLSGMHGFINDTRSCHLRLKQFWKCVQSRSLQAWLNIYASSKKEDQFINCSDRNSLQNCLAKQIQVINYVYLKTR